MALLSTLGIAFVVFVSTNIDDIFLLAALFADPRLHPRAVVAGQFLGMAVLVAASAAAGLAALAVPAPYVALLGLAPLGIGLVKLWELLRGEVDDDDDARKAEQGPSQVLAITAITVANGGDNLGVYIPLFAREPGDIWVHALVFAVLTGALCLAGHALVQNRLVGEHVKRYGHVALPLVLIGLGVWILRGAASLVGL